MPTNLYGPNDNFHLKNSHVIPALIRKFHEAKIRKKPFVAVWGSGKPMREFMHVDDMAEASIYIMSLDKFTFEKSNISNFSHINIGTGQEISINNLAQMIKKVVGYSGEIRFDPDMPDGTFKKMLDVSKINKMGWSHSISLKCGLEDTYKWFLRNQDK